MTDTQIRKKMKTHDHNTRYATRKIDLEYGNWFKQVNNTITRLIGVDCDDLKDEKYRDYFDNETNIEDVINYVYIENYSAWKTSIEKKVFKNIKVFLDIIPDKLYMEMFCEKKSYNTVADLIIRQHENDDITKWMISVDGYVFKNVGMHLDEMKNIFYDIQYLHAFNSNINSIIFANQLLDMYVWIIKIDRIVYDKTGSYLMRFQIDDLCQKYHYSLCPKEVSKEICNNYFNNKFTLWRTQVDLIVFKSTGFHLDDLPDEDYMVQFENKTTAKNMAQIVIYNFYAGWDFLIRCQNHKI